MSDATPLTGIVCPSCRGSRLTIYRTRHPAPGLCVRHRRCPTCDTRVRTRERVETVVAKKKDIPVPALPESPVE